MKKIIVLIVLSVAITGFATAGSLALHLGVGYHSSFIGEFPAEFTSELTSMPSGLGGYFGIGYAFDTEETWSIGGEVAPSWDFGIQDGYFLSSLNHHLRGFVKFKPFDFLTVTGLFGYAGDVMLSIVTADDDDDGYDDDGYDDGDEVGDPVTFNGNAVLGLRVTVFPIYIEYDMVTPWDFSTIYKHEVGIGFAIIK